MGQAMLRRGSLLAYLTGVTFRIDVMRDAGLDVVVIDGRLDAEAVAELMRVVAELSGPVRLGLGGLMSVDEAGLDALHALHARGAVLTGVSPYFRLLLGLEDRGAAPEPRSTPGGTGKAKRGWRKL